MKVGLGGDETIDPLGYLRFENVVKNETDGSPASPGDEIIV
jgi:hypothetical protein